MGKVIKKIVERSFKNFLRGVWYPRLQGRNRYDSFTYPQMGFALCTGEQVEPLKHYRKVEDKLRVAGKNLSRKVVSLVAAHNTTQFCSGCGEMVKKSLAVRIHKCPICR